MLSMSTVKPCADTYYIYMQYVHTTQLGICKYFPQFWPFCQFSILYFTKWVSLGLLAVYLLLLLINELLHMCVKPFSQRRSSVMRTPPRTTSMTIHCEVLRRRVFSTYYYQIGQERDESPDSFLFLFTNRQFQHQCQIAPFQTHIIERIAQCSPQLLMLLAEKVLGQRYIKVSVFAYFCVANKLSYYMPCSEFRCLLF